MSHKGTRLFPKRMGNCDIVNLRFNRVKVSHIIHEKRRIARMGRYIVEVFGGIKVEAARLINHAEAVSRPV